MTNQLHWLTACLLTLGEYQKNGVMASTKEDAAKAREFTLDADF